MLKAITSKQFGSFTPYDYIYVAVLPFCICFAVMPRVPVMEKGPVLLGVETHEKTVPTPKSLQSKHKIRDGHVLLNQGYLVYY